MEHYYFAIDAAGRTWRVPESAVRNDYIEFLVQADNISRKDAEARTDKDQSWKEYWWNEQVIVYPELVMQIGEMIKDITEEEKLRVINSRAASHMKHL